MFAEKNTRLGFLEDAAYDRLAAACAKRGLWLRAMFEVAYQFGWRSDELKSMRVRQADLATQTLRLEPGTTKNDEGREAVMPPLLFSLIQQCVTGKEADDYVFTRERQQRTVLDFRSAWYESTVEAGFKAADEKTKRPGLLFYDLRRTAVRNMVRRGIPERVAMRITGRKTRAVFDRYHIVTQTDLQEAALKMSLPIPQHTIDAQSERKSDGARPN